LAVIALRSAWDRRHKCIEEFECLKQKEQEQEQGRVDLYESLNMKAQRARSPALLNTISELPRTLMEIGALSMSMPLLRRLPAGDGHPVMLIPGFMASDTSMLVLARYLRHLGYKTLGWELGRNTGHPDTLHSDLANRFETVVRDAEVPVTLIGQSLGGVYSREIARKYPDHVRQVITLGSPFSMSGSDGSNGLVRRLFEQQSGVSVEQMRERFADDSSPPVPLTAIYSKGDGVVHWRGCMEKDEDAITQNIRVPGSHCGMGFNPIIYRIVADRLSQRVGEWTKYKSAM
jgi:pimeloyl-ACP methyl ester carboxylesterase|tara:strand:- start:1453 stop:2319 length:867 start_codon:yes stop_codon:yes gene_type:complete